MALKARTWDETSGRAGAIGWLADVFSLTKPRLSLLVLLTTAGGIGLAPVRLSLLSTLACVVATAMVVGGANALNCYLERESDERMTRTRARPLPAGRLSPATALVFGLSSATLALIVLSVHANPLTAVLAAVAFVSYVLIYTPLKSVTPLAMVVGAFPGAIPPVMGWTAATNEIGWPALVLFSILFFWQLPHFLGIAVMQQNEYARAGIATIPGSYGRRWTVAAAVASAVGLLVVSVLPVVMGMAGVLYGVAAVGLGLAGIWRASTRSADLRPWARRVFLFSLIHLAALFAALTLDGIIASWT